MKTAHVENLNFVVRFAVIFRNRKAFLNSKMARLFLIVQQKE